MAKTNSVRADEELTGQISDPPKTFMDIGVKKKADGRFVTKIRCYKVIDGERMPIEGSGLIINERTMPIFIQLMQASFREMSSRAAHGE